MKRRTFLSNLGALAVAGTVRANPSSLLSNLRTGLNPDLAEGNRKDSLQPFHVNLPRQIEALPFGSDRPNAHPAFPIRGLKGWAWSPEQYLTEIPILAKYRLNFLTNCYSSLWELGPHGRLGSDEKINFWYRPIPAERKAGFEKVIRSCQQHGIMFCFSINPNLRSDRAFDYDSAEDMNTLWQHYEWSQKLGVKWFNFSLDDISSGIDASGQARAVNALLQRLRARDPEATLTFCPTWYSGTGDAGIESNTTLGAKAETSQDESGADTPGVRYTKTIARELDSSVYLLWTGPDVCSLTISEEQAQRYRALSGHRILLFDNYPVNDQNPTMHLGPFSGRSGNLHSAIDGYFLNSMGYQVQANRIPLLTLADYLWNPAQYDPARSIGQAITHLGHTPAARDVLRDLVELYPGRLWDQSKETAWNSLRVRFDQLKENGQKDKASALLARTSATLGRMKTIFPDAWESGTRIVEEDVKAMSRQMV